jgi:predicted aspartyl protease
VCAAAVAAAPARGPAEPAATPLRVAARIPFVDDVMVNGQGPFTFILDTGATETVITPPLARQLGIQGRWATPRQKKGTAASIRAGDAEARDVPVYILDPPQAVTLRLNHGINYHGILGSTFLSRFITTVDFGHGRVTFASAAAVAPAKTGRAPRVALEVRGGLLYASARVNGLGPFPLLVDTGSAEVVILPRLAAALGPMAAGPADGAGAKFVRLDSVSLGDARVEDVPAILHPARRGLGAGVSGDGILGHPFLSRFVVTVNYRDRFLELAPGQADAKKR